MFAKIDQSVNRIIFYFYFLPFILEFCQWLNTIMPVDSLVSPIAYFYGNKNDFLSKNEILSIFKKDYEKHN
jgi:hypothetical protein